MEIDKNKKIIIILLVIILIILSAVCIFGLMNNNKETLVINDINIERDAFGIYNLIGHITPQKDFDYLEARITFYDNSGTVIGKSPIAWNIIDAKAGEKLSIGNGMGGTCEGNPAYAIVEFYDYTGSDTPIANATITFNGNNTNTTDTNTVAQSSTDNDKQYSQEDLDLAKSEGYAEGYSDSYNDNYYYDDDDYSDDSYYDSSSSGSSSGGSSSGSGSSSSGASDSAVETTTGLI